MPPSTGQTTLVQLRVICSPAVEAVTIDRVVGLGYVRMIAPLLGAENADVPRWF